MIEELAVEAAVSATQPDQVVSVTRGNKVSNLAGTSSMGCKVIHSWLPNQQQSPGQHSQKHKLTLCPSPPPPPTALGINATASPQISGSLGGGITRAAHQLFLGGGAPLFTFTLLQQPALPPLLRPPIHRRRMEERPGFIFTFTSNVSSLQPPTPLPCHEHRRLR